MLLQLTPGKLGKWRQTSHSQSCTPPQGNFHQSTQLLHPMKTHMSWGTNPHSGLDCPIFNPKNYSSKPKDQSYQCLSSQHSLSNSPWPLPSHTGLHPQATLEAKVLGAVFKIYGRQITQSVISSIHLDIRFIKHIMLKTSIHLLTHSASSP